MRDCLKSGLRWRKAELHSHCSADPMDYRVCSYSPEQLIQEAARLGYEVFAITCHNLDIWSRELSEYAESLGITLIPGMEVTTEGTRHLLAYNFRTGSENLNRLEKVRAHAREDTLVIAPHPYYLGHTCLRHRVEQNLDMFDALEVSGFHTRWADFNPRTRLIARRHGKPMVGNGDVHYLWQLGRTCTWIYSEPGILPVVEAVKRGNVRVETSPLSSLQVVNWWARTLWHHAFPANKRPISDRLQPIYD